MDNVTEDKNIQTHYFIKFLNSSSLEENMLDLKKVEFTHDNTVGPKSISKPEVIREFNKLINPNQQVASSYHQYKEQQNSVQLTNHLY